MPALPIANQRVQNPATDLNARRDERKNAEVRYVFAKPSMDACSICYDPLSNDVVAHIQDKNPRPLHSLHRRCVQTALTISRFCPLCRAPVAPDAQLPISLKDKLIEGCTSLLTVGKAVAIVKLAEMIFQMSFKPEEMVVGFVGSAATYASNVIIVNSQTLPRFLIALGAFAGVSGGLLNLVDERMGIAENLIEKFGFLAALGIPGIGAPIGFISALKILQIAKQLFPCIRQADISVGHSILRPLKIITGLFGASLATKIAQKILPKLI